MNPEKINIEGEPFWRYRIMVNSAIDEALKKMILTDTDEGTVTGKIMIQIHPETDADTGEIIRKTIFTFETLMEVPVKRKLKDTEDTVFYVRDGGDGHRYICDNQITMDDIVDQEGGPPWKT